MAFLLCSAKSLNEFYTLYREVVHTYILRKAFYFILIYILYVCLIEPLRLRHSLRAFIFLFIVHRVLPILIQFDWALFFYLLGRDTRCIKISKYQNMKQTCSSIKYHTLLLVWKSFESFGKLFYFKYNKRSSLLVFKIIFNVLQT